MGHLWFVRGKVELQNDRRSVSTLPSAIEIEE